MSKPAKATSAGLHPPVRNYLVTQVVEMLAGQIKRGKFRNELPGEYPLCESLNISRTTLRAALDILQKRGYVRSSQGRPRKILRKYRAVREHDAHRVVYVLAGRPLTVLAHRALLLRVQLTLHLQRRGLPCQYVVDKRFVVGEPGLALRKICSNFSDHLWILASCSAATQAWFYSRGYPAFVHGHLHPGIHLPAFDVNFHGIGRHAASYLRARGHRHVALIFAYPVAAGDASLREGFFEVQDDDGAGRLSVQTITMGWRREDVVATVAKLLRQRPRPTAICVTNEAFAIWLYSALLLNGIRIPQDISIIVGTAGPLLDQLNPDFTRYENNSPAELRRTCRIIVDFAVHGTVNPTWRYFTPNFHPGETVFTRSTKLESRNTPIF